MIRSRYRRIVFFFARVILSHLWWDVVLPRIGFRKLARRNRTKRLQHTAASFRAVAVQMGGVLIKVGQFLSARVDILPPEFTRELEGLQDEVPPVAFPAIRSMVEQEFGQRLLAKFVAFDETPLAAASLGQVHRARITQTAAEASGQIAPALESGNTSAYNVVVKVQRPNIERLIETDLAALRTVGAWLHRYRPIRKRANIPALINEFTKILYEEIDYLAEGRNAEIFAENFKQFSGVRVPGVYWTHTTRRVLTLENVFAIKITDYQAITGAGVSRAAVASRLLDTYLKQIFEDGFFHADPHPGNLFVHPLQDPSEMGEDEAANWELTFVDFGMTGKVPPNLRQGLRELLIGVGTQDSGRVVKAYQMMDLLLPNTDLALLERAEARVFEQFWGKNMSELSSVSYQEMKELTDEFRDLIYEMPFQVPHNLIFLGRCVGILSGMCTGLDPQFNLWDHLAPYARKIMAEEASKFQENWLAEAGKLARTLLAMPHRVDQILQMIERGEIAVRTPEIDRHIRRLERIMRDIIITVIFAAFFLGAIQLYQGNHTALAIASLVGAFFSLFFGLINRQQN
jgi:predicted unusual protein kinase regulating ubiquinone biosynthesis (AarF/ABC1/UbiB family)